MGAWMNHRVGEGFLVTRWFSIGGLIAVVACSILLANKFRAWVESKQS
jgi:hypothetical protein